MELHTLQSAAGVTVRFITIGGAIVEILAPDRHGRTLNVVLAHAHLEAYRTQKAYFGAVCGRYANRIAGAAFVLDGRRYELAPTDGSSSVHGGRAGFDKAAFEVELSREAGAETAILRYTSPDGEEGYPGELQVEMRYRLSAEGVLEIAYAATTDRPTVVNLTNHSYFNLAGEGSGSTERHVLEVFADRYTPSDALLIPTGEIASVTETPFDFRRPTTIGARLRNPHPQMLAARGYDVNYVLAVAGDGTPTKACTLLEPDSGRTLEIATTAPGLQFYSGNNLDGTTVGPSGRSYRQGDGLCFEPHHFPDTPNRPAFPSCRLDPGATYRSRTSYRFGAA